MNLSICIITKNEEQKLSRCLEALAAFPGEIVVVDTGSTDTSVETASRYTDHIFSYQWADDFAAAKNFAIAKASSDWILILDTDEYVQPETGFDWKLFMEELERMFSADACAIGRIRRVNGYHDGEEWTETKEYINRIFDRRYYHYSGRIHEQIVPIEDSCNHQITANRKDDENVHMICTSLCIFHDGYDGTPEERREKARRNQRLLLKEWELNPTDTYLLYQLGKSAFMAGMYADAVHYFELALGYDLNPKLEYVIDMVQTYGYALLKTGQTEVALQFEGLIQDFGDTADFWFLMGLIYMNNELFEEAVAAFEKAATFSDASALGTNSFKAYYNAGVIRECLGQKKAALSYYKECKDYDKAVQRIRLLS